MSNPCLVHLHKICGAKNPQSLSKPPRPFVCPQEEETAALLTLQVGSQEMENFSTIHYLSAVLHPFAGLVVVGRPAERFA